MPARPPRDRRAIGQNVRIVDRDGHAPEAARTGRPEVPADPPGRWRLATVADGDVVLDWYERFHAEADEQAGRPPDPNPPHFAPGELEARIDDGLMSLWVLDDLPVHLTAWNSPAHGVVRVGPVFTPESTGAGVCRSTVARVSAAALEAGHRAVC